VLLAFIYMCAVINPVMANGFISIDRCSDQYLLAVADLEDIQGVSFEAADHRSFYASRAIGLPIVKPSVEEILVQKPSLVMLTYRGGPRVVNIMSRVGISSFTPPYAASLKENADILKKVGAVLGQPEKAAIIADQYQKRFAALEAASRSDLKAVYMTPGGFTAGMGTYVDDVIKLAGFETVANEADIKGWVQLPLEQVVLLPPDFIVASFFEDSDIHVSHWSSGRHGVYKRLMGNLPTIHVPSRFLSCSGAFSVDAAEFIRGEAIRMKLIGEEGAQ